MTEASRMSSRRDVIKLGVLALSGPALLVSTHAGAHEPGLAADIALVSLPQGNDVKRHVLNGSAPVRVQAGDRLFEVTADAIDDNWCRLQAKLNGQAIVDSRMGWGGYMWHRSGLLFMLPGAMLAEPVASGHITAWVGVVEQAPKVTSMVRGVGRGTMPLQDARIVYASVTAADASCKTSCKVLHWNLTRADGSRLNLVSYRDGLLKIDEGLYLLQRVV